MTTLPKNQININNNKMINQFGLTEKNELILTYNNITKRYCYKAWKN